MKKDTIVYIIRHAETIDECGIRNTEETQQEINEKEILSIEGEHAAEKLSENIELLDIDLIYSSHYARAKQTAKYIAYKNNLQYNLDKRLGERKLGNMKDLAKFMSDKTTRDPSFEQLKFRNFKTRGGESANETNKRANEVITEIVTNNKGKKIAVISHGGSIKFYLLSFCEVDKDMNLLYKGKVLNIKSPCLLKLTFRDNELIDLKQIE